MDTDEAFEVLNQYERVFGRPAPRPIHVDVVDIAAVAQRFIKLGTLIPNSYDWHPDLPEGALI